MHKRIKNIVSGGDDEGDFVVGNGALSYYSSSEGNLINLVVSGNTTESYGSVGEYYPAIKCYKLNVRIHGRNFMGGDELYVQSKDNLGSKLNELYDDECDEFMYSFNSPDINNYLTKPGCPSFKENTVYTIRFRYYGTPNASTGIAVQYTDGSREDIISGDRKTCNIAFTTVENKTVKCLAPSLNFEDTGTIYLATFGIFEGKTSYDDFEEYRGSVYDLNIKGALGGIKDGNRSAFDTFDWSKKACVHKTHVMTVKKTTVNLKDGKNRPVVIEVPLEKACAYPNPLINFFGYEFRESYDDILDDIYLYTVGDENTVYVTANLTINESNYNTLFSTPQKMVYKTAKWDYLSESSCIDIPKVPAGYVGIEVYRGISAGPIKAFYKK